MRIASLLASATEIVCTLGLDHLLVGISHECDYPARVLDRPRLSKSRFDPAGMSSREVDEAVRHAMVEHGSVYELDGPVLREVDPDLIITQAVCEVCAVPTSLAEQAARLLKSHARVLSLDSHSMADVLQSILEVGKAADAEAAARTVFGGLQERLARVRTRVSGVPRPSVLAIEWLAPPFVPGHWVPEMIEEAGGSLVVGEAHVPSRQTSWENLGEHDPDVLLLMPCGYGLEASRAEADRHEQRLRALAPRAIESGSAFVVDGSSYFNRSGPRMIDGVEILVTLLHPGLLEGVNLSGKAERWGGGNRLD